MPPFLPLAMMGLGAVSKGVGAVGSYFDQRRAQRQLDALGRQALPQYAVNPAVARIYAGAQREVASPEGFTGAERNAFMQNIASGLNTQAANARAIGGGSMSRAISGVLSGNQLGQYNQFAAQNATLARQNRNAAYSRLMGAANTMQGISNQNTSMLANRRLRQEELLGQAIASQRAYRTNLLNSLGSDLTTAGTYGLMGGMGETDSGIDFSKMFGRKQPPRFNPATARQQASLYNFDGGNLNVDVYPNEAPAFNPEAARRQAGLYNF
jgi:hypothetical protein